MAENKNRSAEEATVGRVGRAGRLASGEARALLQPGRNCWRIETASRAACLVDGEAYFSAAKQALLRARHSVILLGWDFVEGARLEPDRSDPEWPGALGDFMKALVERRQGLRIHVLVWDKVPLLAMGLHRVPGAQTWDMNEERLRYRLDTEHPALATHHQKVLVIDDAVAFCGGFDFAGNRWDTRAHAPSDPRRRLPTGAAYEPHHDVAIAVDGPAARALGDLARERWQIATGEQLDPAPPGLDAWPDELAPNFRDVPVGIARTAPAWRERPERREIEQLYLDAIAAARETIYLESQYLASHEIGKALASRLAEPHGPEIVILNPKRSPSWGEQVAMDNARTEIAHHLCEADRFDRYRLFAATNQGEEIIVHSKVMVVDDRLLRIGSSNLNSRSMGVDTECDLAIEAGDGPAEAPRREAILGFRNDLIAEHLGVSGPDFSRAVAEHGSVVRAIDALNGTSERRLAAFPSPRPRKLHPVEHNRLTDPLDPLGPNRPPMPHAGLGWHPGVTIGVAALTLLSSILAFRWLRKRTG